VTQAHSDFCFTVLAYSMETGADKNTRKLIKPNSNCLLNNWNLKIWLHNHKCKILLHRTLRTHRHSMIA